MKSHIKAATILFTGGLLLGIIVGLLKEEPPAFIAWKFLLVDFNQDTLIIIGNNLLAAYVTAYGPVLAWRLLGLKKDPGGAALIYLMPTVILFLNGFTTGFFIGATLKIGISQTLLSILPHGILEIPAIIVSGAIGLRNIEGLERDDVIPLKYFIVVALVLVVGAVIEGSITPVLSGTAPPEVEIVDMHVEGDVVLGRNATVALELINKGIVGVNTTIVISSEGGGIRRQGLYLPRGRNIYYLNITPHKSGKQDYTSVILWRGQVLTQKNSTLIVRKPNVRITDIHIPELYAGEDNTLIFDIENRENFSMQLLLVFSSTTGAITQASVALDPHTNLTYFYNASFGQPGERRFGVDLYYFNDLIDSKVVNATVKGLRISPKILDVKIPEMKVNKTSQILIRIKNMGEKGGNISLLLFEGDMPQILRTGGSTSIFLSRTHIAKGIWKTYDTEVLPGEEKNISISVVASYPHTGKLLVFALRREVISDVWIGEINVTQTQ
jgi:hypothetical protein